VLPLVAKEPKHVKYRLLSWLVCPGCRFPDLRLETVKTRSSDVFVGHFEDGDTPPGVDLDHRKEQEVMEGELYCGGCGSVFAIKGGVPRMMLTGAQKGPSTKHAHTQVDPSRREWEQNFQDLASPLAPSDFLGKVVLDAGCGFGRHLFFAARYGAEVVGIDSSAEAVDAAFRNAGHLSRAHIVQADICRPPFRDATFDLSYCFGVLHHLEDPHTAFKAIGQTVRPGGRLSLWVYGPRQGMTGLASRLVRDISKNMPAKDLEQVCTGIARALRLFSHTPYKLLRYVPVAGDLVRHLPVHDHHRWAFDVVVADVYDRLRIPVHHWFTGEALERMLANDGYGSVSVTRRVRNNETFRATGIRR
jgi:SAM-dependent methyltransferase